MLSPTRRLVAAVSIVSTLSATAAVIAVPDHLAAGGDDAGPLPSVAALAPDPTLDARILSLELRGRTWTRAVEQLDRAIFEQTETARERARTADLFGSLEQDQRDTLRTLFEATDNKALLVAELAEIEIVVRARAVDLFVHHGEGELEAFDSARADTERMRSRNLAEEVTEVNLGQRADLMARLDTLGSEIEALEARGQELAVRIGATEAALAKLDGRVAELDEEVPAATAAVVQSRRTASIVGLDMSVVALDAYLGAEHLLAADWPTCSIEWWMIAGVARIESRHGAIGGRRLAADGRPSTPIVGIPLDGRPGVREILDSDGGRFDGDAVHDRAVGPLQFIPETWIRRGRDGNGDGSVDPQSMYDAAYSTGRYLCALGDDLAGSAALRSAYFGYNTSSEYVDAVHGHAVRYSSFTLPAVDNRVENQPAAGD